MARIEVCAKYPLQHVPLPRTFGYLCGQRIRTALDHGLNLCFAIPRARLHLGMNLEHHAPRAAGRLPRRPAQPLVVKRDGKERGFSGQGHEGSSLEELREAISYGVIKMNNDT